MALENPGPGGQIGPATVHFPITPSDTVDLPSVPRALIILTAGTLRIRGFNGADITYPAEVATAGRQLDFSPIRVLATGTTCTLVGWA